MPNIPAVITSDIAFKSARLASVRPCVRVRICIEYVCAYACMLCNQNIIVLYVIVSLWLFRMTPKIVSLQITRGVTY